MELFWYNQQISGAIIVIRSLDSGMMNIRERTRHTQNIMTSKMSMIKHFGNQAAVDDKDLGDLSYEIWTQNETSNEMKQSNNAMVRKICILK